MRSRAAWTVSRADSSPPLTRAARSVAGVNMRSIAAMGRPEPTRDDRRTGGAFSPATEIAEPDKEGGSLRYRGVGIENLVGQVPFEKVWGLLVDGTFEPGLPPAEPHPLARASVMALSLVDRGERLMGFGHRVYR